MSVHRLRSASGYSLVELLISSAIMLIVTGGIFAIVHPSQGTASTQPEVADLQQRTRVASEVLFKELMMAGAGVYQGEVTGSLINFFAPIIPKRLGRVNPDVGDVAFDDVITLAYIPNTYSQTTISNNMPTVSSELKVAGQRNCPADVDQLCGFEEGMDVIIFDTSGNFDVFTITEVQDAAAHLQHRGQDLSFPYEMGASVTQIVSNTYYWCSPINDRPCPDDPNAWQLRMYDGFSRDLPLVDDVVGVRFEYFGDPDPPLNPRPPLGTANCLYDATGGYIGPSALSTTDGSLAELPLSMLKDGPWCGAANSSNRFDADLLRVRKVRVTLRVQVADPTLRGSGSSWVNPGTATGGVKEVADYTVAFDVTPRNLNLSR